MLSAIPAAHLCVGLALCVLLPACAGTLPEPIYGNQVDGYFPADGAVAIEMDEPSESLATGEGEVGEGPREEGIVEGEVDGEAEVETGVEASDEAVVAAADGDLHEAARLCAARLNGHRESAEVVSILQAIISGVGGAASGVGGVFAAIDFGDPDLTTAMGIVASVGAGITLIGNLIIGFAANPLEELRLRAQAERSWQLAVELQFAHGDPSAVHENLMRCASDEAPEARVVGEGEPFSMGAL
jgi:hypothetical protein